MAIVDTDWREGRVYPSAASGNHVRGPVSRDLHCAYCYKPVMGLAIEWETTIWHGPCALGFIVRLMRDVHEYELRAGNIGAYP